MSKKEIETLKQICLEVKEDMQNRKEDMIKIHTTEDFFYWRDHIKKQHNENSTIRNEIVENAIKGNQTLEILYDWTKFYRILDKVRARTFILKEKLTDYKVDSVHKKELEALHTIPFYRYLKANTDIYVQNLFEMVKVGGFGFRYNEFPTFHTLYEFLKMITHEEIYGPFAIDILVCLLRACNITGKDLVGCARKVEEEEKILFYKIQREIQAVKK